MSLLTIIALVVGVLEPLVSFALIGGSRERELAWSRRTRVAVAAVAVAAWLALCGASAHAYLIKVPAASVNSRRRTSS